MNPNKIKLSDFFNATITLGAVTAYLYIFGRLFERGYFQYFLVEELMELSFEEIVSRSWLYALLVIIPPTGVIIFKSNIKEFIINGKPWQIPIVVFFSSLFLPALFIVCLRYIYDFLILFLIMALTIWGLIKTSVKFHKPKLTIERSDYHFVPLFFVLLLYSLIFALYAGQTRAKLLLNSSSYETITLTVEGKTQPPQNAIFIAHMGDKYIICPQDSRQGHIKVIVIEDSKVLKAEISKLRKTKTKNKPKPKQKQ